MGDAPELRHAAVVAAVRRRRRATVQPAYPPLMTVKIFFKEECRRVARRWTFDELHAFAQLRFDLEKRIFSLRVRDGTCLVDNDETLAAQWAKAKGKPLCLTIIIDGDDEVEVEEEEEPDHHSAKKQRGEGSSHDA